MMVVPMNYKNNYSGSGEMAQHFRALASLPEEQGVVPSILMVTDNIWNSSSRDSDALFWPLCTLYACNTDIHTGKIPIHIK